MKSYRWIPRLFLLASLTFTAIFTLMTYRYEHTKEKELFSSHVMDAQNHIKSRLSNYFDALNSGSAFIEGSDHVNKEEWHRFYKRLFANGNYPGLMGIGIVEYTDKETLKHFEAKISDLRGEPFHVWPSVTQESRLTPVILLEPENEKNRKVIGYNSYGENAPRIAMQKALKTGRPALTNAIPLIQEGGTLGLLLYAPFFDKKLPTATAAMREKAVLGFSYAVFSISDMLSHVLGANTSIQFKVQDITHPNTPHTLYTYQIEDEKTPQHDLEEYRDLYFAQRTWRITYHPSSLFVAHVSERTPYLFSFVLLIVFLALYFILRYLVASRMALHASGTWINGILNASPDGIHVLNTSGILVACSPSFASMLGYERDEIIGKSVITWNKKERPEDVVANLQHIKAQDFYVFQTEHTRKDGTTIPVEISARAFTAEGTLYYFASSRDIGERIEARHAYLEALKNAQNYLDIVDVMILVLDTQKNVVLINRKGCEILGYTQEELLGVNFIQKCIPERLRPEVHEVGDALKTVEPTVPLYYENPVVTHGGRERLIAWHNKPLYDAQGHFKGILTSGEDITERKAIETEHLKLAQVINQNPFPTFITDIDGTIVHVNKQALLASGYSFDELIGSNMRIFKSGQHDKTFYQELWKCVKKEHAVWNGVLYDRMKDGSIRDWESTIFPIFDQEEKIMNFVSIKHDVTQQNLKDKLFMVQTRQAQMGEMLSMIAHQWRQPLTIINTIAATIRLDEMFKETPNETTIQNLIKIEEQTTHLSQTITDFRDFFKPDKPKEFTTLEEIIKTALNLMARTFETHGVTVQLETRANPEIFTYRNEVLQVFMTLFKNTLDALEERAIEESKLEIVFDQTQTHAVVALTDEAGGIKADVIDKIFLPYFTTKEKLQGTGIGLYMAKTVIEEHCGGSITARSDHEHTTTFTITLPLDHS